MKAREEGFGLVAQNIPGTLLLAESYEELRERLAAYAGLRESEEKGRTHYRVLLSFERDVEASVIRGMVREWLEQAFPKARALAFVHRNTGHPHVHVWLDARGIDGKKLHLSGREYRRMDEGWNRIYSRQMGRSEREHLEKKAKTILSRRGRAGSERFYEADQVRLRGDDRCASGGAPERALPAPGASGENLLPTPGERASALLSHSSEHAVSETRRLREALERLGERARPVTARDPHS